MNAGRALRRARKRAGLSQRELAARAGVSPSTVARIELGEIEPRVTTLDLLLRSAGARLEVVDAQESGVDRSLIRDQLQLSPRARIENAATAAEFARRLTAARRESGRKGWRDA
jgi:transcriptional regulator with XRE-family HTH domain